jgi:hypothetical protein
MKSLAFVGMIALVVIAAGCAGKNAGVGASSSGSGGGGTSSGSSGSGTGDDASDGGSGSCESPEIASSRACVPKRAKANAPLTIEIEGDGCLACGATPGTCDVAVDEALKKVLLTLRSRQCAVPAEGCTKECRKAKTTCAIPPLAVGTYRLELGMGVRVSTDEVRTLLVEAAGSDASCTLPAGEPPPIDPTPSQKQCTPGNDAECTLVIEGDVCKPCLCPTDAIAVSAKPDYDAEINARRAACDSGSGSPSCIACIQSHDAKCVAGTCTAVPK